MTKILSNSFLHRTPTQSTATKPSDYPWTTYRTRENSYPVFFLLRRVLTTQTEELDVNRWILKKSKFDLAFGLFHMLITSLTNYQISDSSWGLGFRV